MASWWEDKPQMIAYLESRYDTAWNNAGKAMVHWGQASAHWSASEDHLAIWDILRALEDLGSSLQYLSDNRASLIDPPYPMIYYLKNFTSDPGEGGDLTWEDIVNAWIVAPLEGQQWSVGMVDYMRKTIWNKPFNFPLKPAPIGG